ncbi:MAG: TolC family protein [Phycisphaerales bacterium]
MLKNHRKPRSFAPMGTTFSISAIIASIGLCGCSSPIERQSEKEIQLAMIRAIDSEIAYAKDHPSEQSFQSTLDLSKLEIRKDHLEQIEDGFSVDGYLDHLAKDHPDNEHPITALLGKDLLGQPTTLIGLDLEQTVHTAVANNLSVEVASFQPAIAQSQLTSAEAQFDWIFSASATYKDSIIPQAGSGFGGSTGFVRNASQAADGSVGVERQLESGGTLSVTNDVNYTNVDSSFFGTSPTPNPANASNITVGLNQPLLKGFGRDVNLAQVQLARNAERTGTVNLKSSLIDATSETEKAYWTLVLRYKELVIKSKLLERGIKVRDDIKARRVQDARQAQVADAVARVERRRSDLLIAQTNLRNASDRLKSLMNDPSLPVGSETLIVPSEDAPIGPMNYSLLDAITNAVHKRPEMELALLTIDDSTIRQQVAKNQRLPVLDLQAQARLLGFGDSLSDAYNDDDATRFIDDWLLGLSFKQPIGNRIGEAEYRKARLERMQAVVAYRQTAQRIVLDVKVALNALVTNHALIDQTTLSRVAQGEALRALIVEKELTNAGYSVERLNLELNQQEALANAEIAQATALTNYQIAIIDLHKAMGTTLEHARIDFVVPDANQLAPGESALDSQPKTEPESAPETDAGDE